MGLWSRIKRTFGGGTRESEIAEELQFHLAMQAEAGHNSRLRLGNATQVGEETRSMGIVEWLDSLLQDARYGLRQIRKTPGLALAVVLSVALGVGANTAIFSLIDVALLRPIPVKDPASLRILEWTNNGFPKGVSNINGDFKTIAGERRQGSSVSAFIHRKLAKEQTGFAALIGVADADAIAIATDGSPAEQVKLQWVSHGFFQGLGVTPETGRGFREEEDHPGHEPVIIVSHRFWVNRLAGDSAVAGRVVRVNNMPARIVGVAPRDFFGLRPGEWNDVYAPLAMRAIFRPRANNEPRAEDDTDWWVRQIARVHSQTGETAAMAQLQSLFGSSIQPQNEPAKVPQLTALPGHKGFDALNPQDRRALWILMLLVGVLLLIVCANVANLLLSRSVSRQRESSVRLALGASRARLLRQHLVESGVLALVGGGAGLGLGYLLAQSIHLLFQIGRDASSAFDLHLNPRVLVYTGAISMLTALLFGLAPALRAARAGVNDSLKAHTRSVVGGSLKLPRLLVATQIALCLVSLVAAGLLGRTLNNLTKLDIGFERQNLAYATVSPGRAGYTPERVTEYTDRVRDALLRAPGIGGVSTTQIRSLSGNGNNLAFESPGRTERNRANLNAVGPEFFDTVGIPVLAGRTFQSRDARPDSGVVVVDEIFARRYFPNENPVGRRFGTNNRLQIIGVVGNSKYNSMRGDMYPTLYEPFRSGGTIHFVIRSTVDSSQLMQAVRRAVASVDPAVALTEFHTQTGLIDRLLRTERLLSFVSGAFGVVALALAAIGLGGLLAYTVARRTNEIGVRMAIGAEGSDVIRMVLSDSVWMVAGGILIGLPCAYFVGQFLATMIFQLEPVDASTTAMSFAALLSVALMAAWIPARRAARIDPLTALREE